MELVPNSLPHALRHRGEAVLASWAHRFERSPLRMPRPIDPRQHGATVAGLIEALGEATMSPASELRPGASAVRELEKVTTFAGAGMSAAGASGYDVAALVVALRDAVLEFASADEHARVAELFEWLVVLALDAFASAGVMAARERWDAQLEAGIPVLLVTPDVPAVILLGAPSSSTIDGVLGRVMLLVVRTGARALLVDIAGLADARAPIVLEAIDRFFAQPRLAKVELLLIGAADDAAKAWLQIGARRGVTVRPIDRFDEAVAIALDRAGTVLVRRP
ncbi:MAG: hypothetical protein K8W52_44995 [Deltaproteobacteria bacterium]|nr:hypothetical protein [Deltaproteobacteria bacterium]